MPLRPLLFNAVLGMLVTLTGGCATMTPQPPSVAAPHSLAGRDSLPGRPGCFWKSDFQGDWTVLNETTLIVSAPVLKDAYLIKLFEPVTDLPFMQRLGFEDAERTGRICKDDYLIVPGSQRRVSIVAVNVLTKHEQRQLLQAAGKPEPHGHPGREAASPKG